MEEYRNEEKLGEDLVNQITGDYINNFDDTGRRLNIAQSGRYQGGQTDYNTGTGFFLGMSGGQFKFSIGNPSGNYLTWDGSSLTISGSLSATTITGSTFQTAASGKRIVIASADNTLRFYDATDQIIGIGTDSGIAMTMSLTGNTNSGISITSSSNSIAYGLNITLSGASNAGANYQFNNAGTSGAFGILGTISNGAVGMYITASGTGDGITINSSGTAQSAIHIYSVSQSAAMTIENNASGGNPTGLKLDVSNSAGNGYAFEFAGDIVESAGFAGAITRKIRVKIGAGVWYMYLYDA